MANGKMLTGLFLVVLKPILGFKLGAPSADPDPIPVWASIFQSSSTAALRTCGTWFAEHPSGDFGRDLSYELQCTSGYSGSQCACFSQGPPEQAKISACLGAATGKAIYMIGDSHTHRLDMRLPDAIPTTTTYKYYGVTGGRPAPGTDNAIIPQLRNVLKSGDSILFARRHFPDGYGHQYAADLNRYLTLATETGASLSVLYDNHWLPQTPQLCLLQQQPCSTPKSTFLAAPRRQVLDEFKANHPSVHVFDVLSVLCPGATCNMYVPGTSTMAFIDQTHLSEWAVDYVVDHMCGFISEIA